MSVIREAVIEVLAKAVIEAANDLPPDTARAIANAVLDAILAMEGEQ